MDRVLSPRRAIGRAAGGRLLVFAAAVLSGACSIATPPIVAGRAVAAALSADEQWLAWWSAPARRPSGAFVGPLMISPRQGGAGKLLDASSSGGTFSGGSVLYFLGGVQAVSEGTPAREELYGALSAWLPTQADPVRLGALVHDYYVSADGSAAAWIDQTAPSQTASGALYAWSSLGCGLPAGCAPIKIADGVRPTDVSLRMGPGGRQVLVALRDPALPTGPGRVLLVALPSGLLTTLSTAAEPRSTMVSGDGAVLAWVEGASTIVVDRVGVAIVMLTAATPRVEAAAMIDAGSFVTRDRAASGATALDRVTAKATIPLGIDHPLGFSVAAIATGGRILFYSQSAGGDLWALDLTGAGARPVPLATQSPGTWPQLSPDGKLVRFFDAFDVVSSRGDLYVAELSTGGKTKVGAAIQSPAGVAFEPSSERLLFIDSPDPVSGEGTLTVYDVASIAARAVAPHVVSFLQSRASSTVFTSREEGAASDGIYAIADP